MYFPTEVKTDYFPLNSVSLVGRGLIVKTRGGPMPKRKTRKYKTPNILPFVYVGERFFRFDFLVVGSSS